MKIAVSDGIEYALNCNYRLTEVEATDFTNIAVIVVTMEDLPKAHAEIEDLGFSIPIFEVIKADSFSVVIPLADASSYTSVKTYSALTLVMRTWV